MTRRQIRHWAGVVLTVAVVAGCGDSGSSDGSATTGPATSADLAGRTFVSTGVTQAGQPYDLVKGSRITVSFDDGRISANAGCNSMSGGASLDGGILTVDSGGLATTEMACDQPLMDQDTWLSGVLTSGPTVTLDADRLTLASGDTVVEFLDEQTANPDVPLTDTLWTLDSMGDSGDSAQGSVSSVPSGVESTMTIAENGSLVLRAGCNNGHGHVEVGDDTLTFGPIATTRMMCPDDQMKVETTVLQVLDGTVSYAIDGDVLTISADAGTLTYRATP